ncbi:TlpA family protein disulfide reductase [Allomuricauda sp. R78024]|uniref:TlpA family protein disulfide reductase n=1 Tax=Allomuricauda sp. R78024 TaxID=3093867 RepID=UPI0037C5C7AF
MKTIKTLLLLCLFINGCKSNQELKTIFSFEVGSEKITGILVSKYNFESEKFVELESLSFGELGENYRIIDQYLEPSIYTVKLNTGKEMRIAVEQSGLIKLRLDEEILLESNVAAESNFNQSIESLNKEFFADMIQDFDLAMKNNDVERIAELEKRKDEVLVKFIAAMENLVRKMGPSALAYDALAYFDLYKNNKFFKEMLEKFEAEYPESGMSSSLRIRIDMADQFKIGGKAINFKANNMEGSLVDLAHFKGSYVLVDFWASWCRPCRVENPKLMVLYEEYKDVKFDIIGVSIDSDASLWRKAIEKDGIGWNQILDKDQSIFKLYLLSSLPSNFLLDPEGIIIAKNINAEELEVKLNAVR